MSLFNDQRVTIPPHCAIVPVGGKKYVYLRTEYYRNANKNSTTKRRALGRYEEETGLLIPNENYYDQYHLPLPGLPERIRSFGTYNVLRKISEEIGLTGILQKSFPETWEQLLTIAQYMISGKEAMVYLNDWLDENVSFTKETMYSSQISELFGNLDENSKTEFFRLWLERHATKEFTAYDVSSISSYSRNIEDIEWGYNRDKEKLPQINLAMYYGQETDLPFYYRTYPGSITDKVHLQYMMEDLDELDHRNGCYVLDRGFYSKENLKYMASEAIKFLIAMPGGLNLYEKLIEQHRGEIIDRYDCRLGDGLPYGKVVELTEYGFRMNVHIFYDERKKPLDTEAFYSSLNDMEAELKKADKLPGKQSRLYRYFDIREENGKIVYERKADGIDKELRLCGFFILAETTFRYTTAEILDIYRHRDMVEKSFDDLKNELDMSRLKVHSDQVVNGKMFSAFIGLILRSVMMKRLKTYLRNEKISFRKVMIELGKIKACYSPEKEAGFRLYNPLTKKQKEILSVLGFDPEDFISSCVV